MDHKIKFSDHPEWDFAIREGPAIQAGPSIFPRADRILALSDLEGEFEGLRQLLLIAGVIDLSYDWTFGEGHLVLCGDMVDRGPYVPELLWFLYSLQQAATVKGGHVHMIIGNHEIMNLSGDFRYAPLEFTDMYGEVLPAYADMLHNSALLGRWVRSWNCMELIGDLLFVHGGISKPVNALQLSIEKLNETCRPFYSLAMDPLVYVNPELWVLLGGATAPFWYRGYFSPPSATQAQVNRTLKQYGCERIVAGHTLVKQVAPFYKGRVIGLDVNHHTGHHEALLVEAGRYYRLEADGQRTLLK